MKVLLGLSIFLLLVFFAVLVPPADIIVGLKTIVILGLVAAFCFYRRVYRKEVR